jgi:hypothetical protein
VIIPAPERAVAVRPVQPDRERPAVGVVGEHHEERGDPEPATAHALARPWLDVRDLYRRHNRKPIRTGPKCRLCTRHTVYWMQPSGRGRVARGVQGRSVSPNFADGVIEHPESVT